MKRDMDLCRQIDREIDARKSGETLRCFIQTGGSTPAPVGAGENSKREFQTLADPFRGSSVA